MNEFKRFGYHIIERNYGKWGTYKLAKWDHPLDGPQFYFDEEFVDLVAQYSIPGSLVVDIGAHSGDSAVPMAIAVKGEGLVVAFEPNPAVFEILQASSLLNPSIAPIVPIPCAVLDRSMVTEFHYTDENYCNGGFASETQTGVGVLGNVHPCTVRCLPLSTMVPPYRIAFAKIDTEGMETRILKSSLHRFVADSTVILMEVYLGATSAEKEAQLALVDSWGYKVSRWKGDDYLCVLK